MADHVIVQARDAIIARIKAAVTSAGTRVYAMHEMPADEVDVTSPFVMVEIGDDEAERMALGGGPDPSVPQILEDINQTYFIHCVAKMDGDAEKSAYNLRGEVEAALLGSVAGLTLGGTVQMLRRTGGFNNRDQAIDQEVFNAALQVVAQIRHLEGSPTSFTY